MRGGGWSLQVIIIILDMFNMYKYSFLQSLSVLYCLILYSRCTNQSKLHSEPSSMTTDPKSPLRSNDVSLSDFGHSLMAGFSETYLTDFVLHGTSQPLSEFKESLISDLSSIIKVIAKICETFK